MEQIRATLTAMPTGSDIDLHNRALLEFAILTGIRDCAMAPLRLKHIDVHQMLEIPDPSKIKTNSF